MTTTKPKIYDTRKKKMLLLMPVMVLPFITLGFWALGGGRPAGQQRRDNAVDKGLNLQLPVASLKPERGLDKMSYYEMAAEDAARIKAEQRSDPYLNIKNMETGNMIAGDSAKTSNEAAIYTKLRQINAVLDSNRRVNEPTVTVLVPPTVQQSPLPRSVQTMAAEQKPVVAESDPEMQQIDGMLDKIMDIQHPERLREKLQKTGGQQQPEPYAVKASNMNDTGFYSFGDGGAPVEPGHATEAVVAETQILVNGATIKLRLTSAVVVNGRELPRNHPVFGTVALNAERLCITVSSLRLDNTILPVSLAAYDMDGLAGIYVPGSVSRDVARQSADNTLQAFALNSLDPSLGAQAAGAGIETAKNLISKKVKLVRVTVKAGYRVLLRDNNIK